ncbi:hypothetical protein LP421_02255 (plasmid) [Rhizobium sp. RCAM05350]|nr:hypothetical protein LP421_02255 [Rhizobium sp. RCAM05350]
MRLPQASVFDADMESANEVGDLFGDLVHDRHDAKILADAGYEESAPIVLLGKCSNPE